MSVIILDDFRTNRKHLDLAQERVLPTSKTASPRMPGGAVPRLEAGVWASEQQAAHPRWEILPLIASCFDKNPSSSKLDRQQVGVRGAGTRQQNRCKASPFLLSIYPRSLLRAGDDVKKKPTSPPHH